MKTACSVLALAVCGVLGAANGAAAAEAATGQISELIVTAQKRAQSLQDVPVSVAVVSADKIQDLNIKNLDQLSSYVPGLRIVEGGEQTGISIRGFGAALNFGIDQDVGLFVDEIYEGRERQFRGTFLDLDHVEVLKGPQGTLFGKNTIAGAITITSGLPNQTPLLKMNTEYSPTTNKRSVELVGNTPLGDTLSARLAIRVAKDDGYMHNQLTGDDEEQQEDEIARLSVLWKPTDKLTVKAKIEGSQYNRIGRNYLLSSISGLAVGRPIVTNAGTLAPISPGVDVGAAARLSIYRFYDPAFKPGFSFTTSKQRESSHVISRNALLDVSYDLGFGSLRSITGYESYHSNDQRDVDWSPTPFLYEPITQRFNQRSQELRLVSNIGKNFDYIVGLYYFRTEFFVDRRTDVDINLFFPVITNDPTRKFSNLRFLDQKAETHSAYAQGTWHLTPTLDLTGGLRWMTETKDATDRLDFAQFGTTRFLDPVHNPADAALLAQAHVFNAGLETTRHTNVGHLTEENTTPEARLTWKPSRDVMVYASAARAYKGGGFNSNAITQNKSDYGFRPEKSTAFEVGTKLRFPEVGLSTNLAVFRQEITDLQLSVWQGNGFFLTNAGAARSQGFEGDATWRVSDRLDLNGAFSVIDARYTQPVEIACNIGQLNFGQPGCAKNAAGANVQQANGRRFAPRYSATLGAGYAQPIPRELEVLFRADANFYAKGQFPLDSTIVQPALQLLDLSATLRPMDAHQHWNLAVLVQNALDKKYFNYEFEAPAQTGSRVGFPAAPRRVTFRASYQF